MLLFRSEEHVERWSRSRNLPKGAVLSIDQLWGLATAWYGERMEPHWRRRTAEEAEEVFRSLGLAGEFWRLT
jgi:hypothetical protein